MLSEHRVLGRTKIPAKVHKKLNDAVVVKKLSVAKRFKTMDNSCIQSTALDGFLSEISNFQMSGGFQSPTSQRWVREPIRGADKASWKSKKWSRYEHYKLNLAFLLLFWDQIYVRWTLCCDLVLEIKSGTAEIKSPWAAWFISNWLLSKRTKLVGLWPCLTTWVVKAAVPKVPIEQKRSQLRRQSTMGQMSTFLISGMVPNIQQTDEDYYDVIRRSSIGSRSDMDQVAHRTLISS